MDRRNFLAAGAAAGVGLALTNSPVRAKAQKHSRQPVSQLPQVDQKPLDVVKIGFVGVGGMGSNHIINLLNIKGAQITAVCDIVPEKVEKIQQWVTDKGFPRPAGYSRGPRDFERLCEKEDVDIVMTATPWKWHVPVCVSAMENGKHAATEVPAAVTIEECWKLVETAEKYRRHCVMLENCCYDRFEMMMFQVAKKGLLGGLVHAECGYMHDLREVKFAKGGEALWRTEHSVKRNGNLYPTHGLGPIAQCLDINRGDKMNYLVSMSSPSMGLQEYAEEHLDPDNPWRKRDFKLGDVNTSLIKTDKGRTIVIGHDTNLPRPYSRKILLQGTKGIMRKYPEPRVHIEGRSPTHKWETAQPYYEKFEHPLWEMVQQKNIKGIGHGGMDFLEQYQLVHALLRGAKPDIDVYDAAAWSAVAEVSERSVANNSAPAEIPDFTRGTWKKRKPLEFLNTWQNA